MQDQIGSWRIRAPAMAIVAAAPKVVIQYVASSTNTAEVIHFSISQTSGTVTAGIDGVGLIVPSAVSTMATAGVTTAGTTQTVYDLAGGASTLRASLSTTTLATGPTTQGGTINSVPKKFNFFCLAGYEWNAQPNERIWVPASGIIQLYIYGILSATWDCEMTIREMK